jgi:hypothetical protein
MTTNCECPACYGARQAADAMARYRAKQAHDAEMVGSAGRLQQMIDQHYRDNPGFINEVNVAACR